MKLTCISKPINEYATAKSAPKVKFMLNLNYRGLCTVHQVLQGNKVVDVGTELNKDLLMGDDPISGWMWIDSKPYKWTHNEGSLKKYVVALYEAGLPILAIKNLVTGSTFFKGLVDEEQPDENKDMLKFIMNILDEAPIK